VFKPAKNGVLAISPLLEAKKFQRVLSILYMVAAVAAPIMKSVSNCFGFD
jgi:hypothetical protein